MFKGLVQAIKVVGKAKASLEAIDDDIDLDGHRELDQLKEKFENVVHLFKEMIPEIRDGVAIIVRLVDHVAKAGG